MVQFTEVIPAIFDHREVHIFPGTGDGGYEPQAHALELPFSVLSMEPGPPGTPGTLYIHVVVGPCGIIACGEDRQSKRKDADAR